MKIIIAFLSVLIASSSYAQTFNNSSLDYFSRLENVNESAQSFNNNLKPFYHGVASGDPMTDRVIIWTRVTPDNNQLSIEVKYKVATDTAMLNTVQEGVFIASEATDFTVKVDVKNLPSDQYLYYQFDALNKKSIIGRTKTAPQANVSQLKFAVVSCSNYEAGYFNAYNTLSTYNDLDAIIHLGDYIYEYEPKKYGDTLLKKYSQPAKEIIELNDYRTRYSFYRLDEDLIKIHQQHPFIAIWDDHESANDSYKDGAENHQANEGDWQMRKEAAKKAYFEWMPIRENDQRKIYRTLNYGDLAKLILLDTRLEERSKQDTSMAQSDFLSSERTMLGQTQFEWLLNELKQTEAKWKIIGNQVIFSELNLGFAATKPTDPASRLDIENTFLDIWDGYYAERNKILDSLESFKAKNVVMITGDFHSAFGFEIARPAINLSASPSAAYQYLPILPNKYNTTTGEGALGIEFVTPSITSANFDEYLPKATADLFEFVINKPIPTAGNLNFNPHMKYVDLDRNGFLILSLTDSSSQADYYYVDTIKNRNFTTSFDKGLSVKKDSTKILLKDQPASRKVLQGIPAPQPKIIVNTGKTATSFMTLFDVFPNPVKDFTTIRYGISRQGNLKINLYGVGGELVKSIANHNHQPGLYFLKIDLENVKRGIYFLKFESEQESIVSKLVME